VQKQTVVIVGEDGDVALTLGRVLSTIGIDPVVVDRNSAVAALEGLNPSLVVCDLNHDSFEEPLKFRKACPDLPILMLGSHSGENAIPVHLRGGALAYLRKTFSNQEFIVKIKSLIAGLPRSTSGLNSGE
jgi:two-component system, NtrC family, nitrogen regulation response regulator GlnG